MADNLVITIAREYGSGGLKISKRLAEELGISHYDSDVLTQVSTNINNLSMLSEKVKDNESLMDAAKHNYEGEALPKESDDFLSMEKLFSYQSAIIKELAEKESCVIVGRCANYILGNKPNVIRVFIHAPMEFRVKRKSLVHSELSSKGLETYINRIDGHKASYYKYYTGYEWTDCRNYDLVLDCSVLGIQNCIDRIKEFAELKSGMKIEK